jgi:hypothetical protein
MRQLCPAAVTHTKYPGVKMKWPRCYSSVGRAAELYRKKEKKKKKNISPSRSEFPIRTDTNVNKWQG